MKKISCFLALLCFGLVSLVRDGQAKPLTILHVFELNSQVDLPDHNPGDGACSTGVEENLCTLRAAVMEAAVLQDPVQVMIPPGNYLLSRPPLETNDTATGDLDIRGSIELIGAGASQTVISGNELDRVFDIASGAVVSFSDLTIQNGKSILLPFDGGYESGGGMRVGDLAVVIMDRCILQSNTGGAGGGIFNLGELNISQSEILDNNSEIGSSGGGIFNGGKLIVEHTLLQGNRAYQGGGIYHYSDTLLEIRSSTIEEQPSGGGLVAAGPVLVENTTIRGNQQDGGIILAGLFSDSEFIVRSSTISGNHALASPYYQRSGGITLRGGQLLLTNTTVSGNTTTRSGGGILVEGGMVQANNLTITENQAASAGDLVENGGGIAILNGFITLQNTILAGNYRSTQPNECFGVLHSTGYNLFSGATACGLENDPTSVIVAGNPGLGPLQNNGGETDTHALSIDSPAIDSGNPSGCMERAIRLTQDQRGFPRATGLRCDTGAFEASGYQLNFPTILR